MIHIKKRWECFPSLFLFPSTIIDYRHPESKIISKIVRKYHMTAIACRILVIILGLAISGLAMSDSKLSTKDDSYYERARLWQNGWTLVFSSSIASQLYTLSVPESDPGKHFDARISMVTSGSGLLSILLNPLPGSWDLQSWLMKLAHNKTAAGGAQNPPLWVSVRFLTVHH